MTFVSNAMIIVSHAHNAFQIIVHPVIMVFNYFKIIASFVAKTVLNATLLPVFYALKISSYKMVFVSVASLNVKFVSHPKFVYPVRRDMFKFKTNVLLVSLIA